MIMPANGKALEPSGFPLVSVRFLEEEPSVKMQCTPWTEAACVKTRGRKHFSEKVRSCWHWMLHLMLVKKKATLQHNEHQSSFTFDHVLYHFLYVSRLVKAIWLRQWGSHFPFAAFLASRVEVLAHFISISVSQPNQLIVVRLCLAIKLHLFCHRIIAFTWDVSQWLQVMLFQGYAARLQETDGVKGGFKRFD